MDQNVVESFQEEVEEDFSVDRITLASKLQRGASIQNKWCFRLYQHNKKLKSLLRKKKELWSTAFITLPERNDVRLKNIKTEKGKTLYIESLKGIKKIQEEIDEEQLVVDYLYEVVEACKWTFSKSMMANVDLIKIEEGA